MEINSRKGLDEFFRNPVSHRTTGKGINRYVISMKEARKPCVDYLEYLKTFIVLNSNKSKCTKLNLYANDVVNECLWNLHNGSIGYLFTEEQLHELIRIYGFNIVLDRQDGIWYLSAK